MSIIGDNQLSLQKADPKLTSGIFFPPLRKSLHAESPFRPAITLPPTSVSVTDFFIIESS